MPRVSIITAAYNRSDVLRCAMLSVQRQTYSDWEHIIVGDACTDDTAEVVAKFADSRTRFVNRAENCGEQSAPNNDGFALSSGSLIAYLNQDDLWFPDHLESLVSFIDETNADLVYAMPFDIDRYGRPSCGITNAELRYDPTHFIVASLWLVRRELIDELGGWRSAMVIDALTPSQDLLTRAWRSTKDIRCHPRLTAIFLASGGRPGSFTQRDSSQHEAILKAMESPGYRELLLTQCSLNAARHISELQSRPWPARLNRAIDRAILRTGRRPDEVRRWLLRRPRGWWVDYSRKVGGLEPLSRSTGEHSTSAQVDKQ
jgi:hypothetical protein